MPPNAIYVCLLGIIYLAALIFLHGDTRTRALLFGGPVVYLLQVTLILQSSRRRYDLHAAVNKKVDAWRLLCEYLASLSVAVPLGFYLRRADDGTTIYMPLVILALCKIASGDMRQVTTQADRLLFAILQGYFITYGYFVFVLCATAAGRQTFAAWDFHSLTAATWVFIDFAKSILLVGSFAIILPGLDNEIRSIDKRPLSWFFTLLCYPPLFDLLEENLIDLDRKYVWDEVLAQQFTAQCVYGSITLLLAIAYSADLFAWQCDFSQLCYRKLVKSGPFRVLRHPAYVFKCMFFWAAAFPLLAPNRRAIIWQCVQLSIISVIYYLRARAEDVHLRKQTDYNRHFFQGDEEPHAMHDTVKNDAR